MKMYARGDHVGPYRIVRPLREIPGGMCAVYLARSRADADGPRLVALKVSTPDGPGADLLKCEAEHLRQLADQHIVGLLPIHKARTSRGQPIYIAKVEPNRPRSPWYIVTEYMRGGSLAQLLARRGRLGWTEAAEIAWQVSVGLSRIHARQLAHLDIKPDNLLFRTPLSRWLSRAPQVVIADFGIARPIGRPQAGTLYGSPPYVAPERAAGAPPQPYNDVFSVGVLLYEMIAGRLPFAGPPPPDAPLEEWCDSRQLTRAAPPELERVVLRALAPNPRQRYQSARQLRRALEALPLAERPARMRTALFKPGLNAR